MKSVIVSAFVESPQGELHAVGRVWLDDRLSRIGAVRGRHDDGGGMARTRVALAAVCRAGVCAIYPARGGTEVMSAADSRLRAFAFAIAAVAVAGASGWIFWSMREAEPIVAGPGVTAQRMLSATEPSLAGGPGDTPVFELAGPKPGGTMMILGGTHPQEIGGVLTAVPVTADA